MTHNPDMVIINGIFVKRKELLRALAEHERISNEKFLKYFDKQIKNNPNYAKEICFKQGKPYIFEDETGQIKTEWPPVFNRSNNEEKE